MVVSVNPRGGSNSKEWSKSAVVIPRTSGYVTKRHCPTGYVAVTKPLAEQLYNANVDLTLCGNNVNSYHVFGGWHIGCTVKSICEDSTEFSSILVDFLHYLDPELGTYAVFYVKKSDLAVYRKGNA